MSTETRAMEALTPAQRAAASRVLAEEEARRGHLVVALCGAHAYGFASPDSDVDLKAVHVDPTARVLGLVPPSTSADRLEVVDGVEVDYTSNEIRDVLRGVLQGNGNYVERIVAASALHASDALEGLRPLVARALSRRIHRHYRGFATSQRHEFERPGAASAKRALYVLRTTLTGAHALRTGAVVPDLTALMDEYGFAHAAELIARKREGERVGLEPDERERWRGEFARAFEVLDDAHARSPLPEEPPNAAELEHWLLALRRARF